jgi:menaquinone reductase, multiheme cytochrome c subunit
MMRGLALFAGGALLTAIPGWLMFPNLLYRRVEQPVAFNHQVHTGKAGMACNDCHSVKDDGSFSGIPALAGCANCHAAPMGTSKAEKDFIEAYVTPGREPKWLVYARQPENAWFPHAPHIARAKLACERCHGNHGKTTTLVAYEENRISGYSRDVMGRPGRTVGMRMDNCVECHHQQGLEHSCLDCHR